MKIVVNVKVLRDAMRVAKACICKLSKSGYGMQAFAYAYLETDDKAGSIRVLAVNQSSCRVEQHIPCCAVNGGRYGIDADAILSALKEFKDANAVTLIVNKDGVTLSASGMSLSAGSVYLTVQTYLIYRLSKAVLLLL